MGLFFCHKDIPCQMHIYNLRSSNKVQETDYDILMLLLAGVEGAMCFGISSRLPLSVKRSLCVVASCGLF